MRTEELKIYTFEELSKKAQKKAIESYRQDTDYFIYSDELSETLEAISKATNCDYDIYSYDGVEYRVTLSSDEDYGILNLSGVRAYKFIYNNYIKPYRKGKYLKHHKNKAVYSNVIFNYDCPFTGVCFDMVLFSVFEDFTKLIKDGANLSIKYFIESVAEIYGEEWTNSNECELSKEFITDYFISNEYEFLEDGTRY